MLVFSVNYERSYHSKACLLSIRPRLDYEDGIYNQPLNQSLSNRRDSVQCKAALAITKANKMSSWEKWHQELGLEYLHHSR